jgi:adenine-specific DNA-methyltransferase
MTKEIKKVKDDLIAELDKRIADKIIEKTNADLLKRLIEQADTINEAIMIAELGTTYKRTGFHFDKRLEKMTDTIKYFKKNEKLSFIQDKKFLTHKLIIGDNYDALLNLLIEYRGKIDVIYIDPPYGKDSMGEFAQTNYENRKRQLNKCWTKYYCNSSCRCLFPVCVYFKAIR